MLGYVRITSKVCVTLLLLNGAIGVGFAGTGFTCPEPTPLVSRDVFVETKAKVEGLRMLAGAELQNKTSVIAKSVMDTAPNLDKLQVIGLLANLNCQSWGHSNLTKEELDERIKGFNQLVYNLVMGNSSMTKAHEEPVRQMPKPRSQGGASPRTESNEARSNKIKVDAEIQALIYADIKKGATQIKRRVDDFYMDAIGGIYLKNITYDMLLEAEASLKMSERNLEKGPMNVIVFPESERESYAFQFCSALDQAFRIFDKNFEKFGARMDDDAFVAVKRLRETKVASYFLEDIDKQDCQIHSLHKEPKGEFGLVAFKIKKPEFTKSELASFIQSLRYIDTLSDRKLDAGRRPL